jgi:pimeloyl-ACP methyl ester carboxylesterase
MKTRDKVLTGLIGINLLLTGTAVFNAAVKKAATAGKLLSDGKDILNYPFKLGNIRYTQSGTSQPLLLLHDLDPSACGQDWNRVTAGLSKNHKLLIPDLLGCGVSDKPNLMYTNYVYVEMLSDFIRSVIGKKVDVIAAGNTGPLLLMTARMNPDLIGRIVLVSPDHVSSGILTPGKEERFLFKCIQLPIIGTLLYNIFADKHHLAEQIIRQDFTSPFDQPDQILLARYEASHLGTYPKALFASLLCNFVKCDIRPAVTELKNPCLLIYGSGQRTGKQKAESFLALNHLIRTAVITGCKRYPQIEQPDLFIQTIEPFLQNPS